MRKLFRNPMMWTAVILFAGWIFSGVLHLAGGQSRTTSAEDSNEVGWWMKVIGQPIIDPETGLRSITVENPFNGETEVVYYAGIEVANRHPWLVDDHAFVVPRQGFGGGGVYFLKVSEEKPPKRLPPKYLSNYECPECIPALYYWSEKERKFINPQGL
jgi:hypothetical protein